MAKVMMSSQDQTISAQTEDQVTLRMVLHCAEFVFA